MLTLPVERTIADRYRLERVLGKGGVAVVYQAADLRLNRTVAIKVLARAVVDGSDIQRRFEREARIAAKLAHPRIVTVHDFGKTRHGSVFLVMEAVDGRTLGQVLKERREPLAVKRIAELFDQILDGLDSAHRIGVVHRDLKPDNVLIIEPDWAVKLLDFGLAKFRGPAEVDQTNLTAPGFVMGTLAYMAPEQLGAKDVDQRADLFAAGVMVIEALTGQRPFQGRSPAQVLTSILQSTVELPGEGPEVARLNRILARCLAHEPEERYRTATELRTDLIPAIRAFGDGAESQGGVEREEVAGP